MNEAIGSMLVDEAASRDGVAARTDALGSQARTLQTMAPEIRAGEETDA